MGVRLSLARRCRDYANQVLRVAYDGPSMPTRLASVPKAERDRKRVCRVPVATGVITGHTQCLC